MPKTLFERTSLRDSCRNERYRSSVHDLPADIFSAHRFSDSTSSTSSSTTSSSIKLLIITAARSRASLRTVAQ
eukprot:8159-Heterococcus_DN1.PRE.1